jgi:hypothetical protein
VRRIRVSFSLRVLFAAVTVLGIWLSSYVVLSRKIHDPIEYSAEILRKCDGSLVLVNSDEVIALRPRVRYLVENSALRVILQPIYYLDRSIRPSYWADVPWGSRARGGTRDAAYYFGLCENTISTTIRPRGAATIHR